MDGVTSERRKASERRTPAERRATADRRRHERRAEAERRARAERRTAADRRGEGSPAAAVVKGQPVVVAPAGPVSDREKLEELVRRLTEFVPNMTNFLASAVQHARACQKGGLLMQSLRARATFQTVGDAIRDAEAHVKNVEPGARGRASSPRS